jgi:crotonobetainyl-CoA:carnitine CoA-transferase CaiB-like acyl-CoA transferase
VQAVRHSTLDSGIEFARALDRDKIVIEVDLDDDPGAATAVVASLIAETDVMFVAGAEALVERQGLRYQELSRLNPRVIMVRIRPSRNALGDLPDLELLVQARAGVLTQINGHRPGPVFGDLDVGSAGAGLSATVGALAGLYQREASGVGCWAETSLYDGVQALLAMITGQVEHHSPSTTLLWKNQGPAEALVYRCADGGFVQLWFGAKGAYEAFLDHMGDPPSEAGYNADMASGALVDRGKRWSERFAAQDRDWWLKDLAGHDFRCEPAWLPGEALRDEHVREVGLAVAHEDPYRGPLTVLGPPVQVTSAGDGDPRGGSGESTAGLLSDVRVLDVSAYLAGPVAALVLAELGADVVKVEPITGDVHRNMQPMFAAGQRGKRAVALDLKSPAAATVLARLFAWSDVVHQNSRLGLADRLGYAEKTVRAANPDVVYSFASGFGEHGPRATLPANDQLMQALSGVEAAQGGDGQPPTYLVWGAIDSTGGWMAACGIIAGLYARRRSGGGQTVSSSLLGAALSLKAGAFIAGDDVVSGPVLDAEQTGYGAAYRLYQCSDGAWLALGVADDETWRRLREVVGLDALPMTAPALRTESGAHQPEEVLLEAAFRGRDAGSWVAELRSVGVPVEPVSAKDRTSFAAGFVDDPVNEQLGRVVTYSWGDLGVVRQPTFPPRLGPVPRAGARAGIPGLGEHTSELLEAVGFTAEERAALVASGTVKGDAAT